jgi:hypothetical protein
MAWPLLDIWRVEVFMPEKQTMKRAQRAKREGKSPSTQAGEFVREEIHHIREGKYGARSTKQAIAIGLSKARRVGVRLAAPKKGKVSESTRRNAERDYQASRRKESHCAVVITGPFGFRLFTSDER